VCPTLQNPSKHPNMPKMEQQLTVFAFISKNYAVFQTLLKIGKISYSVALHYKIYKHFQTLKDYPRMQAYTEIAEHMHVSENTVQRAVKEMEEIINI